eukprot:symbB.v1.2.000847.t1/scaffold37.1/size397765/19
MTQICPRLPASYKDLKDLDPVIDVLNLDLVSYSGSNARGAEVYEAQIKKMQSHCPASQKGKKINGKESFCCFAEPDVAWLIQAIADSRSLNVKAVSIDLKQVKCDTPWASIGEGVQSWGKHTKGICNEPVLVNDSNVKNFLPDAGMTMSSSLIELCHSAACGTLGEGMVLQWDMVFLHNMSYVVEKLSEYDLVSSSERRQGEGNDVLPCRRYGMIRKLVASLSPPKFPGKCHIFSLDTDQQKVAAKLNLASWRLHLPPGCSVVLITDVNVKKWVPDEMPVGGPWAKEMVVAANLGKLLETAASVDIISSAEERFQDTTKCGGSFQANQFIGGRQGSPYHGVAWNLAKDAVEKHCPLEDRSKEIICCFDEDVSCHIPGGSLGEGMSIKAKRWFEAGDFALNTFCLSEQQSLRPAWFQFVLEHKPRLKEAEEYFKEERHMDLTGFFVPFSDVGKRKCEDFFEAETVVGAVYMKSFGEVEGCPLDT